MSRSGYTDHFEHAFDLVRWRGTVARAIRGHRGQRLLRRLITALESMPEPWLTSHQLVAENGECCALGALYLHEGIGHDIDHDDYEGIARDLDASPALVREIEFENDECYPGRIQPDHGKTRHASMLAWAKSHLIESGEKHA